MSESLPKSEHGLLSYFKRLTKKFEQDLQIRLEEETERSWKEYMDGLQDYLDEVEKKIDEVLQENENLRKQLQTEQSGSQELQQLTEQLNEEIQMTREERLKLQAESSRIAQMESDLMDALLIYMPDLYHQIEAQMHSTGR